MNTNTPTPKKREPDIKIDQTVWTHFVTKKHHNSIVIHAERNRRIAIGSRVKGIGMKWVKRAEADVVFPPHKWRDDVPVEDVANVEYRAVYIPGYAGRK